MRERITTALQRWPWLVFRIGREVVGYAYAGRFRSREAYRWTAEVAVYVDEAHRRQMVARRLYAALTAGLRLLGYRSVVAVITLPNEASERMHEVLGFQRVGVFRSAGFKLGRWHDTAWWQLDLGGSTPPDEPLALPEIVDTASWAKVIRSAARMGNP
jgi:phosphinothricin acetyltransferase